MKKYFFMAALAAAMIFASCSNEVPVDNVADHYLAVHISGVVGSRAIEGPGLTTVGSIDLVSGHVFVLSPAGGVVHQEPLKVAVAQSPAGQPLGEKVNSSSSVYVVGNLPPGATPASWTTLTQIIAETEKIETQELYYEAALANVGAVSAIITTAGQPAGHAIAKVDINPVISRIELSQIKSAAKKKDGTPSKITGFSVTGVFVDDYHAEFTWGGSHNPASIFNHGIGQITNTTGYSGLAHMHDRGKWDAVAVDGGGFRTFPTIEGAAKSWTYNVAAGALPRLLIRLENITLEDGWSLEPNTDQPGVYYLTVTGYTGVESFRRGVIYRLGGTGEDGGLIFDEDDLSPIPNPPNVTLAVNVRIIPWDVEEPPVEL
jgi:hypothetical protein